MEKDLNVVQQVSSGRLKGIIIDILTEEDAGKLSSVVIGTVNEVSDAALGLPTTNAPECLTCGAKSSNVNVGTKTSKDCEGHYGLINLPYTILNPYFMSEVAQILNKVCPGCKSVRPSKVKKSDSASSHSAPRNCRYCGRHRDGYPKMKFKVSSKDVLAKTAIIAEVDEKSLNKCSDRSLASDYWDILPKDSARENSDLQSNSGLQSNRRILLPAQVYLILKDVCPRTLEALNKRKNSIFLNSLLVTPNSHRVREFGQRITYDETTRLYRRLIDFRGTANELSARVLDLYKASKIRSEKLSGIQKVYEKQSNNESVSSASGLKNMKEMLLGKRTDLSFRMVVVGDPRIKVDEIGLPFQIAENMLILDSIYFWNWNKLEPCFDFMLHQKGQFSVSRDGQKKCIRHKDMLLAGDSVYRPLIDGDIVLINRPPTIHQHSLIALSVKILPINSVASINPLICLPFRGDFDGDCLHGFVPQSVNTRVELKELVSLNKQLVNGQSGQNLLCLSQDSLTAAYLILQDGVFLNKPEMQQLQMFSACTPKLPSIIQSAARETSWTGKQLFSLLLPLDFEFSYPSSGVYIRQGEVVSFSHGSAWLRDSGENLFQCLLKHCPEKALDFLYAAQEVLCEWLFRRGLSVSLSDLCLSSDPQSRKNLMDDIACGLEEAEKLSDISLLMVNQNQCFLIENSKEDINMLNYSKEYLYVAQQTSEELCQASLSASKSVFRDMQNLVYQYADDTNSLMAMLKAGSKGNQQKLFQHSMCLGLQHSLNPVSFSIPHYLSCASWNNQKDHLSLYKLDGTQKLDSYIPCTVVASSYLAGLNPLECFVHSLTTRDSSFSGQADVSGTLNRNLMFFMRDVILGYDGTVRNSYGNQVVQFDYGTDDMSAVKIDTFTGGHPVGSLAACAITEAAYSALDQPVSALEPSPLIALKKVLDSGVKKNTGSKSASLFLSSRLGKWANGYEFGALEVKDHLESLLLSDIVSEATISFSTAYPANIIPWVCDFQINKEVSIKRKLKVESVIYALNTNCYATAKKMKWELPKLLIETKVCSEANVHKDSSKIFISVALSQKEYADLKSGSLKEYEVLDYLRNVVIPVLLRTVVKGFPEFKKVDILRKDEPSCSRFSKCSSGKPFLRVVMSENCERAKFWNILVEKSLKIRNLVDWDRSHPDDVHDYSKAFGIDTAWMYFINSLNSAISDIGKNILPEHLIVIANCLAMAGEFVSLNSKGLAFQRMEANIHSPFVQACFSNPSDYFIKAAKKGQMDGLQGSVDALAWGQTPSIGTGGQFDILYHGTGHQPAKPTDVYNLLNSQVGCAKPNGNSKLPVKLTSGNYLNHSQKSKTNRCGSSLAGIHEVSRELKRMLQEYAIDSLLSVEDKTNAVRALQFHPRWKEKTGTGDVEIKVGRHPHHKESRCFFLVKPDGTEEDISYHKSIHGALESTDPCKAKSYHSKWLNGKT